jgi:primosomal protein N' (replication factor Y)
LGRNSRKSRILHYLITTDDPLPSEAMVLEKTEANEEDLKELISQGLVFRSPGETLVIPKGSDKEIETALKKRPKSSLTDLKVDLPAPLTTFTDEVLISELSSLGLVELVKQEASIGLSVPSEEALSQIFHLRGGEKYDAVLKQLAREATAVSLSELYAETGAKLNHLRKLAELELIRFGEEEIWRDPLADRYFVPSTAPRLTSDQDNAWQMINTTLSSNNGGEETVPEDRAPEELNIPNSSPDLPSWSTASSGKTPAKKEIASQITPFLLHGVTGSGKTEIYMRTVDHILQRGQRAIILVPEIALTPQTVRRFAARFPGQVAVLHSRLSQGERYDTWRRARQGRFDIVIGPRSALFTPLEDLGVIVIDEEHDQSYKQTPPVPPPYYHARDVAIKLGAITGAVVILGSATPDLVTYHRAQAGRYQLIELPKRIMGHRKRIDSQAASLKLKSRYQQAADDPEETLTIPLPPIQLVDLRQELRAGNRSIFSRALQAAMNDTLDRGEQAILFLNRRGTSTFVMCRDCGLVLNCPRCEMPLTYHRPGMMLVCHHCGRKEPPHKNCPRCHSHRIKYFGTGTEEVEHQVKQYWPQARTVRWDRDTTAGKDKHETLLASFINQEADILVGTQMIAKGLDLPLVTFVGVVSADVSLGLPDYRMGERTFQVLAQVAGRAGRGLLGGRVIIQTYQPDHYAIRTAAEHDFTGFYLEEIRFRTQYSLPPFRRMAKLVIVDPVDRRAEREARRLTKLLQSHIRREALRATELLGPIPPFFNRIDGRYRWQIIIRSPDPTKLIQSVNIPPNWIIDIDPVSTL